MTNLDDFETAFKNALDESDKAFMGSHAAALKSLSAMSQSEVEAITPDTKDLQEYDKLIAVVRAASARNVSNAELASRIKSLGSVAVAIAKKVPSLASIL